MLKGFIYMSYQDSCAQSKQIYFLHAWAKVCITLIYCAIRLQHIYDSPLIIIKLHFIHKVATHSIPLFYLTWTHGNCNIFQLFFQSHFCTLFQPTKVIIKHQHNLQQVTDRDFLCIMSTIYSRTCHNSFIYEDPFPSKW